MKKLLLILVMLISIITTNAQSNDNICDAWTIPIGSTLYANANAATLEAGEPDAVNDATALTWNGLNTYSLWFKFQVPASGDIFINTNHGFTDNGTEFALYHLAPSASAGGPASSVCGDVATYGTLFDYLSEVTYADNCGVFCEPADWNQDCLIPNEWYYVQVWPDDNGERGNVAISVTDNGGSDAAQPYDVPCNAPDITGDAQSTTVLTSASTPSTTLDMTCASDYEVDCCTFGADEDDFGFYPTPTSFNADRSVWFQFTPAQSGSTTIISDLVSGTDFGENFAIYGNLPNAGLPSTYECWHEFEKLYEDSDGTFGGSETAIIATCLEPGYRYYGLSDPADANLPNSASNIWVYDPVGMTDNDIMCLAATDATYNIDMTGSPLQSGTISGDNNDACIETLAGEADFTNAQNGDHTVWHTVTVPPSGVIDFTISSLEYSIYSSNTGGCVGGLTESGFGAGSAIFDQLDLITTSGDPSTTCCLTPGEVLYVQVWGTAGATSNYTIDIEEVEVDAGNSFAIGTTTTSNSSSITPVYVCYNDQVDGASSNFTIPPCMVTDYVLHNNPDPNPGDMTVGTDVFDTPTTVYGAGAPFTNDGSYPYNQTIYLSAVTDGTPFMAPLCPSVDVKDAAPVVFLQEITSDLVGGNTCILYPNSGEIKVQIILNGGFPTYTNINNITGIHNYLINNTGAGILSTNSVEFGEMFEITGLNDGDTYSFTVIDELRCRYTFSGTVNAGLCILPFNLLSFDAELIENDVELNWTINDDSDIESYDLQKSFDGENWNTIRNVISAQNNSTSDYNFTDKNISNSVQFYRLKINSIEENVTYSQVRQITKKDISQISIFPNPFRNHFYIDLLNVEKGNASFEIYDATGKLLYNEQFIIDGNAIKKHINTNQLAQGVYFYSFSINNKSSTSGRIIKAQ